MVRINKSWLELSLRCVGPWPVNTYVLLCPATRQSVLVDPGAEPDTLSALLSDTQPVGILITHTHPDHIGALDVMRTRLNVPVMAYPGPHYEGMTLQADRWLCHGEKIQVGEHCLRVEHAPGHIEDLVCFVLENDDRVIVGDAIFDGGPGKTWSPEGFQITLRTLRNVILAWPDDTVCYPGHGLHFRLGDRRIAIQAFLGKDHTGFFGDATWDM